jgi:hypothetical protein
MTRAADQILEIVSSLPTGKRENRRIMVLQAVIDDSGNEPKSIFYVLAGFVSPVSKWLSFSDEWDNALKLSPSTEYLKTSEAMNLSASGQFSRHRGWNESMRDQRMSIFADVIRRHTELGAASLLSIEILVT